MVSWQSLTFNELTTHQLFDLLKLRVDVFVVEQNCPYPELDEKAYKLIQDIYVDRTIVPIPAFYQAIGGGGPGCITQQLPKGINTSV